MIQPDNPAINDTLGWLLVQGSKFSQGITYLREALIRDANNPEIRYHLAVALSGLKRYEEARHELVIALESGKQFDGQQQAQIMLKKINDLQ